MATTHPLMAEEHEDEVLDREPAPRRREVDWRQPMAYVAMGFSLLSFLVGWFQIANTEQEWEQLPYLASAGGVGVVALGVAVALLVSIEHTRDREAVGELLKEIRSLKRRIEAMDSSTG
ncbi:MAG: hypothetical protein Q8K58_04350 [Acidimicrobiales bacterium]|nr:hypothetical protein [Acidimicrobiales bacterium]